MARCGCADFCGCVLKAGDNVSLTGVGTASEPWVLGMVPPPPDCAVTMDCVGANLGAGMIYEPTARRVRLLYSGDPANIAGPGSDGGIFVPAPGGPGSNAIVVADTTSVDLDGDGTAGTPLRATVVAGSVAVLTANSTSVGFTGAGTTASPLLANVIPGVIPQVQTGGFTGGPNNSTGSATTITFPRAFTGIPSIATNINSGAGVTYSTITRGRAVSATAFTFDTHTPEVTTYTTAFQWIAALTPTAPLTELAAAVPEDGWGFATATCTTPGCPRSGVPVEGVIVPADPAPEYWTGVICGVCDQPVTDVVIDEEGV